MGIPANCANFDSIRTYLQNRNVESPTPKIVHNNFFVLLFIQSVCKRCRRRLWQNPFHFESGDLSGRLCRRSLRIVEIRGHRNYSRVYFLTLSRFTEKTVFSGFVTAWRLARSPVTLSPALDIATIDGVVRTPSSFSRIFGSPPSITAIAELVVPKSIPNIFGIFLFLIFLINSHFYFGWP